MTTRRAGSARVLVVDDHELLARSLVEVLDHHGTARAWSAARSVDALTLARTLRPDVVLLDLDLGDGGCGEDLVRPLVALGAAVIVVTGLDDPLRVSAALDRGACGVLPKSSSTDDLVSAVSTVLSGGALPERDRRTWADRARRKTEAEVRRLAPFRHLTPREEQVLGCLVDGLSAQSIADSWGVSEATVRTQIRGVLVKLGVGSQLAAVAVARRANWAPTS